MGTATYVVKVDSAPPAIQISTPVSAASDALGGSVQAAYSCVDQPGRSGVASCLGTIANGVNIDTASLGSKTFTVTTADVAGNSAVTSINYQVAYAFAGFFQPVDNLPVMNVVKAASSVPVNFSLGGNQGLAIFALGYPLSLKIPCDNGEPSADIEQTVTASNSGLLYDAKTSLYTYVWKTEKSWSGTCREIRLRLIDGTEHDAHFRFK